MVGLREWIRGRFWDRICRRAGEEALAVMSLLRVRSFAKGYVIHHHSPVCIAE